MAKSKQKAVRSHKLFSELYKKINSIPLTLEHFERFYDLKTELMSDQATDKIRKIKHNTPPKKSIKKQK